LKKFCSTVGSIITFIIILSVFGVINIEFIITPIKQVTTDSVANGIKPTLVKLWEGEDKVVTQIVEIVKSPEPIIKYVDRVQTVTNIVHVVTTNRVVEFVTPPKPTINDKWNDIKF